MFKKGGVKYKVTLVFEDCSGLDDDKFVCLTWKRGKKKENQGETKAVKVTDTIANWNETFVIPNCTLFRLSKGGYEEKPILFTLNQVSDPSAKKPKKTPVSATETFNLAECMKEETQSKYINIRPHPSLKKSSMTKYCLSFTIKAELIMEYINTTIINLYIK